MLRTFTRQRFLIPLLALIGGMLASTLVAMTLWNIVDARDRLSFGRSVDQAQNAIEDRLETYTTLLRAGAGLFNANGLNIDRDAFRSFASGLRLRDEYPGIQGLGFSARVAPADVAGFVAAMREQGISSFRIWPDDPRPIYHTIIYLEPLDRRNEAAIGFDMFSEPIRRRAMEQARDTGQPAASGKVELVQEIDQAKQAGFLIYMPVYRGGEIPETVQARREQLAGFVYSPFRVDDLITAIFEGGGNLGLGLWIYDGPPAPENLLHRSGIQADDQASIASRYSESRPLDIAGRRWTVMYVSNQASELSSARSLIPVFFAGGLLATVLVAGALWAEVKARIAADRTSGEAQLRAHELAILNRTGASIAAELDLERIIQTVTDAGTELSGAQIGAFFYDMANEKGESSMLYALSGVSRERISKPAMPRATEVFGLTSHGNAIIRTDDIQQDPRYGSRNPFHELLQDHVPVRSFLAVPVISRSSDVVGGLFFGHAGIGVFRQEHENLLVGIAGQAAIAIDNARLFQEARRELEERRKVEAALRQSEERLRRLNERLEAEVEARTAERDKIWQNSNELMGVFGYDGQRRAINPAWSRVLGYDEETLLSQPMHEITHPEDREALKEAVGKLAQGMLIEPFEDRLRHADGSYRIISWTGIPGEGVFYAIGRDVTQQRHAEEALRQAQKMEAVGQLTGGVAHDFNNLLTIIRSSSDLLRRPDLPEERRRRYVDAIADTVERASKLTGQLLAFARRQALKPEVFDVSERVHSITDMLRTIVGSRIKIVTAIDSKRCFVEADVAQFETALVNTAVNARDAMNGEGTLTVRVEAVSRLPAIRGHAGGVGRFIAVSMTDTGTGIAPDQIAHIFEPFFTTKEIGKGTGLGLSQVYGFAKQSGGDVNVHSELGRGSTFTLYLPEAKSEPDENGHDAARIVLPEAGHGRRVLVVEDNIDVGQFSTQILQDLGYVTTWASNADEALHMLRANPEGFDIVFSDVVMPGMGGVELGKEIRRLYPGIPVVLTSGYSEVLAEKGRHGFELVQKPYAAEELSRVLRKVIGMHARPTRATGS